MFHEAFDCPINFGIEMHIMESCMILRNCLELKPPPGDENIWDAISVSHEERATRHFAQSQDKNLCQATEMSQNVSTLKSREASFDHI